MRVKLAESPHFAKLKEEGEVTKTPLREAFAAAEKPEAGPDRLLRHHVRARRRLVLTFFYVQVFLDRSLGVPEQTKDMLVIIMTVVSAPLYVFFGWLVRPGRPQAGDARRHAAGAGRLFPRLPRASPRPPTRRWPRRSERNAGRCYTDPATCSVQFDPVGTATSTAPATSPRARSPSTGISYTDRDLCRTARRWSSVGTAASRGAGRRRPRTAAASRRSRQAAGKRIKAALAAEGYPDKADPAAMNMPLLIFVLADVFVVAATALYGPQAAALVEMFPTRIRYTAMSLALPCRHRLGRRLPARHQLRSGGDHRQYLRQPLVPGRSSRRCRRSWPCSSSRKPAASRWRNARAKAPSGCRSAARLRPAPGRSAASTDWPSSIARSSRAFFASPVMVISTVRADRIEAGSASRAAPAHRPASGRASRRLRGGLWVHRARPARSGPAKIEAMWPSLPMPSQARSGGHVSSCSRRRRNCRPACNRRCRWRSERRGRRWGGKPGRWRGCCSARPSAAPAGRRWG